MKTDSQLDFPIEGDSYIELSSGPGDTGGPSGTSRDGAGAFEVYEFLMTIDVPLGVNDLSFAYRFCTNEWESEMYYRDFFTASVDGTNTARLPDRNFVTVPNVNDAVGYPESSQFGYDNVSPTVIASTEISRAQGDSIDLTFRIADVNDVWFDSGPPSMRSVSPRTQSKPPRRAHVVSTQPRRRRMRRSHSMRVHRCNRMERSSSRQGD